jgi:hypothetical protein
MPRTPKDHRAWDNALARLRRAAPEVRAQERQIKVDGVSAVRRLKQILHPRKRPADVLSIDGIAFADVAETPTPFHTKMATAVRERQQEIEAELLHGKRSARAREAHARAKEKEPTHGRAISYAKNNQEFLAEANRILREDGEDAYRLFMQMRDQRQHHIVTLKASDAERLATLKPRKGGNWIGMQITEVERTIKETDSKIAEIDRELARIETLRVQRKTLLDLKTAAELMRGHLKDSAAILSGKQALGVAGTNGNGHGKIKRSAPGVMQGAVDAVLTSAPPDGLDVGEMQRQISARDGLSDVTKPAIYSVLTVGKGTGKYANVGGKWKLAAVTSTPVAAQAVAS